MRTKVGGDIGRNIGSLLTVQYTAHMLSIMLHMIARAKPVILLLLLGVAPGHGQTPAPLRHLVERYASEHDFSGTVLVQRQGRTVYSRSFGIADRAFQIPVTADTHFRIASVTKLFTSVLILQLVQEGRIDLDAPIRDALPEFPGDGADRITLHQLLNHTSGLAQWDDVGSYQDAFANGVERYQRPLSSEQLLRLCCSGALAHAAGSQFDYNNADYFVLGRIIEHVTGQSYEEALAERILRPLGLRNTGMAHWDAIIPRLAPTYFYREDQHRLIADMPVYFENWYAAAGLYSTALDLAAFANALFGGRLVRADLLRRLLTPGLDDYGYGLWSYSFARSGHAYRVAKRPGRVMGANSMLYRLLDRGDTVVILANTNQADLDIFAQRIGDVLVGPTGPRPLGGWRPHRSHATQDARSRR
jgi:D-alanyl-D-alanine carboxypeptidase